MSNNHIVDENYEMKMYDLTKDLKVGIEVYEIENLGVGEFTYNGFEIFTYTEDPDGGWDVKEIWGVCDPIGEGLKYNSKTDIELPVIARDEIAEILATEDEATALHYNNYWG
jgi:hypothetical protein